MERMVADMNTKYYKEHEACEILKLSRMTLVRARREGKLGYYKIGTRIMYSAEQLETFMATYVRKPMEAA